MSKKKFVTGTARKSVARPEPPHEDRRTKRNRTRQAAEASAIDESAESIVLPTEAFDAFMEKLEEPPKVIPRLKELLEEYGPWDD